MPDAFDRATYLPDITDCPHPTLQITLSKYIFGLGDTAIVTFSFSEPPLGFTIEDIVAENGTLSGLMVTDNSSIYTALFTPFQNILDPTNIIRVGIGWMTWAYKTPEGTSISSNYSINTMIDPLIYRITTDGFRRGISNGSQRIIPATL